jgi:Purple acid Phosphatase, N-terminal domain
MQSTKKLFLLMIVMTLAVAYAVATPPPQAGQDIRITNGPILEEVTGNAVVIAWSTDVPSNSRVWYAKDKNNLTHVAESPENGSNTHRVRIDNLQPNTTYYFQVESSQARGNRGQGESEGVLSFRTLSSGAQTVRNQRPVVAATDIQAGMQENGRVRITDGPVIEEADSNHARIAWTTNIQGSTRVQYGTDLGSMNKLAEAPWGAGGLTHRVELKNLQPGTTYYFQVETGQAAGSEVESDIFSFRTPNNGEATIRQQQPQMVRSDSPGYGQQRRQRRYGQQVGSGAVDHPMIREAQQALQQARNELSQAAPQFAGHREKALEHVNLAMQELNQALQFAAQQGTPNRYNAANDQGYVQPMASSGVNNSNYPRMTDAQRALEQARNALQQASNQFGGHKQNAIQHIDDALQEINLGIQAAGQR